MVGAWRSGGGCRNARIVVKAVRSGCRATAIATGTGSRMVPCSFRIGAGFSMADCCGRTVVSQQEWPLGVPILPQSPCMWRQHSFSASESCASGKTHAITGTPKSSRSSAAATNLVNSFTGLRVYARIVETRKYRKRYHRAGRTAIGPAGRPFRWPPPVPLSGRGISLFRLFSLCRCPL